MTSLDKAKSILQKQLKKSYGINKDISEIKYNQYFNFIYNNINYFIKINDKFPFESPSINGLIPTRYSATMGIKNLLQNYYNIEKKNTLFFCHNQTGHWLNDYFIKLFGNDYIDSHKIYFDNKKITSDPNIFQGNYTDKDFLEYNKNLWDFIMIPDCAGPLLDLNSIQIFELIKKFVLLLSENGKIIISKISKEVIELIKKNLEANFKITIFHPDILVGQFLHFENGILIIEKNIFSERIIYYDIKKNIILKYPDLSDIDFNNLLIRAIDRIIK